MSKKFTILCVEDNPDTQRMLTFLLTKAGYDVITADDGMQAIQKAKAWRPALILMDMMMPRMSGAETIRRLRHVKVTKDVPILVLSAYQEQALIDEALSEFLGNGDLEVKVLLRSLGGELHLCDPGPAAWIEERKRNWGRKIQYEQ